MRFAAPVHARQWLDVTQLGARGDGRTLDHHAINRAIAHVSGTGGGTVMLPAGRYLCFSIQLASGVALWLAEGVVIEDCRFDRSRGLALEVVDGGIMEGVTARRLSMADVTSAPIFL